MTKTPDPEFEFGPYVPIIKNGDEILIDTQGVVHEYRQSTQRPISQRLVGEILPSDSIIEAPSLVTPLLLKKKTLWPPRHVSDKPASEREETQIGDDDIQVIKVIGRSDTPDIISEISSRYRKPEDYIKTSVIAGLTNNSKPKLASDSGGAILAIDDYIKSSVGELLFGIGLSRVMEYNLEDRARRLENRIRKGDNELSNELADTKKELIHAKQCNNQYEPKRIFRCHMCSFRSEFESVLDHHNETPHMNSTKFYLCNWCDFKTKDSTQILYHNYVMHRRTRCRLDRPLQVHCCRYCPFESNSKRKYTPHVIRCEQMFDKDFNLAPDETDDFPAITPKSITQRDIRVYESTLKNLRLAAYNPHQIKVSSSALGPNGYPILLLPKSCSALTQLAKQQPRQPSMPISEAAAPYSDPNGLIGRGSAGVDRNLASNMDQPSTAPNLLRLLVANNTSNNLPNNRASILQHPKAQSTFANGMTVVRQTQNVVMPPTSQLVPPNKNANAPIEGSAPSPITLSDSEEQSTPKDTSNTNETFVICEICDAYIENSNSFKSHMQWVHRVKIHQRVLESRRPPLNCQKCNWRYFTDQGLERHLLGSHGLVTSNMQDLADNEKDSGRCTICGTRCPRKLVAHMKDVHKVNLRAAQLSYKCTACSATFSFYRHFENHVYRVHGNAESQATGDKS